MLVIYGVGRPSRNVTTFVSVLLSPNSSVDTRVAYLKVLVCGTLGIPCKRLPAVVSVRGLFPSRVLMHLVIVELSLLVGIVPPTRLVRVMWVVGICLFSSNNLTLLWWPTCLRYIIETIVGVILICILEKVKRMLRDVIVKLYVVISLPLLLVMRFRICVTAGPG